MCPAPERATLGIMTAASVRWATLGLALLLAPLARGAVLLGVTWSRTDE
jgi:hypothetical protein